MACGDAKVLIKLEAILRLSDLCKSKENFSVGYGSAVCDTSNEWSLGGPDKEWYVKLTDI